MKRIFVLYTGGTIGMRSGKHGLQPDTAIVSSAPAGFGQCRFHWHVCDPLIDSSAVSPQHWADWLALLERVLPEYDGVLLLHGTDTLAYTANLLALALDTRGKPLILTGAQKPFDAAGSDAPANLHTAVSALLRDDVHGVAVAFAGKLLNAVGCSKVSTERDDGFANVHFGEWRSGAIAFSGSLKRRFDPSVQVLPLYLIPCGVQAAAQSLADTAADAAILLSYGHGNAPDNPLLLETVRRLADAGKPVLNISQAAEGCTAAVYAQGNALRQSGVIDGGRCNIETATALLMLAAANGWTKADIEGELRRLNLIQAA